MDKLRKIERLAVLYLYVILGVDYRQATDIDTIYNDIYVIAVMKRIIEKH